MLHNLEALTELNVMIEGLLHRIDQSGRSKALRAVGRYLRKSQADQIKSQKNPDGSKYTKRKYPKPLRRALRAIRFIYPSSGSGTPRVVFMKQWAFVNKSLITGYDIEAGGKRTFDRTKIIKYLNVKPEEQPKGAGLIPRETVKNQAMFRKIRTSRFLKTGKSEDALEVGFSGRVARIATSHQEGLDGHATRILLGFSAHDEEMIAQIILDQIDF